MMKTLISAFTIVIALCGCLPSPKHDANQSNYDAPLREIYVEQRADCSGIILVSYMDIDCKPHLITEDLGDKVMHKRTVAIGPSEIVGDYDPSCGSTKGPIGVWYSNCFDICVNTISDSDIIEQTIMRVYIWNNGIGSLLGSCDKDDCHFNYERVYKINHRCATFKNWSGHRGIVGELAIFVKKQ